MCEGRLRAFGAEKVKKTWSEVDGRTGTWRVADLWGILVYVAGNFGY